MPICGHNSGIGLAFSDGMSDSPKRGRPAKIKANHYISGRITDSQWKKLKAVEKRLDVNQSEAIRVLLAAAPSASKIPASVHK